MGFVLLLISSLYLFFPFYFLFFPPFFFIDSHFLFLSFPKLENLVSIIRVITIRKAFFSYNVYLSKDSV